MDYRRIWKKHYGDIPKDKNGWTYEIHHIDGNHKNNSIENLKCLTIKEHYDEHYKNGDYGACVMIAKRIGLPHDYISNIKRIKNASIV